MNHRNFLRAFSLAAFIALPLQATKDVKFDSLNSEVPGDVASKDLPKNSEKYAEAARRKALSLLGIKASSIAGVVFTGYKIISLRKKPFSQRMTLTTKESIFAATIGGLAVTSGVEYRTQSRRLKALHDNKAAHPKATPPATTTEKKDADKDKEKDADTKSTTTSNTNKPPHL